MLKKAAYSMLGIQRVSIEVVRKPRPHKTANGLDYFETAIGNYYLPANAPRDNIAHAMKCGRIFEPEIVDVARRFIRPETAVIDVGANFGQMSLLFSQMVGEDGRVYAIEAQRPVFDILTLNIAANRAENVIPFFKAADRESGKVYCFPPPDFRTWGAYGSYNLPLNATSGDPVEGIRVDDIDIELPVSFMKVDVQGFDLFAMQGAKETIAKHRMPILFEFEQQFQHEYGTNFQDYVEFVDSIGYRFTETVMDLNYLVEPKS